MKKILALVLTLTMICGMLVSCANVESMIAKADAALIDTPYKITMSMAFECDDKEMDSVLSAMNMEFPVTVNGNDLSMDINMKVMGYSADVKMVVCDMTMYYDASLMGQSVKMKANMNEEQLKEFSEKNNTEMVVQPADFGQLSVEKKGGKTYITCTDISDEGFEELDEVMKDSLEALNAKVDVSDISYTVVLNKGKYESMDMTCVYAVTVVGKTVNVTMKMKATYSYDNIPEITAPSDASKYQEVKFEDIMN